MIFFESFWIILLATFPGIFLWNYFRDQDNFDIATSLFLCSMSSFVFWVVTFPWLKFIPVPYSMYIYFVFLISIITFVCVKKLRPKYFRLRPDDIWGFLAGLMLVIFIAPLMIQQVVPAGADMAMHTYIARLIHDYNGFPNSYFPLVPIDTFGKYPYGFGVITAAISLLTNIPIHTASLGMTGMALFTFYYSLYIYIAKKTIKPIALLVIGLLFFVCQYVISLLSWGAVPMVYSSAVLVSGFLLLEFTRDTKPTITHVVLMFFIAGAFYIHQIPVVVFGFMYFPLFISQTYMLYTSLKWRAWLLPLGLLFCLIPYLSTAQFPTNDILEWIANWQRKYSSTWTGSWQNWWITIPEYLRQCWGNEYYQITITSIVIALFSKKKPFTHFFAIGIGVLIIINSKYWFLPLSPLLYPDRTVFMMLIPSAVVISIAVQVIDKRMRGMQPAARMALLLLVLSAVFFYGEKVYQYSRATYTLFLNQSKDQSSVTKNDYEVMKWISQYTSSSDVILNNYGDAGIWIPAITGRMVIVNHSNPYDFTELGDGMGRIQPSYIFIGSKAVYADGIRLDRNFFTSPCFSPVFTHGASVVYSINKEDGCTFNHHPYVD